MNPSFDSNNRGRPKPQCQSIHIHRTLPMPGVVTSVVAVVALALLITGCASRTKSPTPLATRPFVGSVSASSPAAVPPADSGLVASGSSLQPRPADELWFITRPISASGPAPREAVDDLPGGGAMVTGVGEGDDVIPLPLRHTDVRARVSAYIAAVEVRQQFENPFSGKIEARYVFPLPQEAAINEFVMRIGERSIRGIIRERAQAERLYAEAKAQGHVATLLTQERPNIFTQSVANIDPGKSIDVTITYYHALPCVDGWYEFVFPMVIGPRFNPPCATNGVGAVNRDATRLSGQPAEISYLRPAERSGHDIALFLDIDAGVEIEEFNTTSHVIESGRPAKERLHVELGRLDRIPNKDFVLRYRVAGERLKSSLLTHRDERGGFLTLTVYPPEDWRGLTQHPLELVFVLDCSGSMSGEPIAKAKAAIRRALLQLRTEDSFQIIRFSEDATRLGHRPLPATAANVQRGLAHLASLESQGGTMMIEGIKAALDFPQDPGRLRFVVFLTDGFIGNESEILSEVNRRLADARIFSFGVGSSANRYLLDGLARIGRGAVAYLGQNDDTVLVMDEFMNRVRRPALMDVRIDWGGLEVKDVYPARLPDVFVGRPLMVTGRFEGTPAGHIRVFGKSGNEPKESVIEVDPTGMDGRNPGLAGIWARKKILELSDRAAVGLDPTLATQIQQTALDYNLMSAYTAFVAVDSMTQTQDSATTTVPQSVPVPEGVASEKTVGGGNAAER